MHRSLFATLVLGCAWLGHVAAHTDFTATEPADGATLDAAPDTVRMDFAGPMRIVKVTVVHAGPDGSSETRLTPPSRDATESLVLSPELAGPGDYRIEWRGLGEDGHVMTGAFSFSGR